MEASSLRECLGRFATGVTVVTYWADGAPRGATVNAFSSISLDPPLILVSLSRKAKAAQYLSEGRGFCVNVLSSSQVDLALNFAGRPRHSPITWVEGSHAPRLAESHAWLECTPWQIYDGGDHLLHLGEVQDLSFDGSEPLLFYSGDFHNRGDELDEHGRVRRPAARSVTPLQETTFRQLGEEFAAGWL
ncbi:flavin reductase family protein [Pimelobacter simplex]|nr:flavin reductase family protein [Pimelobacter simplex]